VWGWWLDGVSLYACCRVEKEKVGVCLCRGGLCERAVGPFFSRGEYVHGRAALSGGL